MQTNTSTPAITPQPEITLPKPPKVAIYRAVLNQSGSNAPSAHVLQNNLIGTVTWARTATGTYTATLTNGFPQYKTTILLYNQDTAQTSVRGGWSNSNTIAFYTYDATPTTADDILSNCTIQINVYDEALIATNPITPIPQTYKVYTAIITQAATDDPTANELQNTIGAITWTRRSEGIYDAELTAAFTENKTLPAGTNANMIPLSNATTGYYNIYRTDENKITLAIYDDLIFTNPVELSDINAGIEIEIRVYN